MRLIIYMIIMAGVTYLIRVLPFAFFTKKITSRYVKSFLHYVPYAVLSAMTFPAIFSSTGNTVTATCGLATALVLALKKCSLITVALSAAGVAYVVGLLLPLL